MCRPLTSLSLANSVRMMFLSFRNSSRSEVSGLRWLSKMKSLTSPSRMALLYVITVRTLQKAVLMLLLSLKECSGVRLYTL